LIRQESGKVRLQSRTRTIPDGRHLEILIQLAGEALDDRTPHVVHDGPDALLVLPPAGLLKPAGVIAVAEGTVGIVDVVGGPMAFDGAA